MTGKRVLVTGGGKRLGRAIALAMGAAGAHVAITYNRSKQEAAEVARALEQAGGRAVAVHCDVRDENSVRKMVKDAESALGGLDVLVNNAGTYERVEFAEISTAQWDNMFATNVRGPFLVSQAALPMLRQSRGRIIHLGSLGGISAWAGHAHYCASKAALHHLTGVMAKALAPEVSVNCVAPGMIDMEEGENPTMERFARMTPMNRNGAAEEVAAAVMFFANAPRFITGQVMAVDGGLAL